MHKAVTFYIEDGVIEVVAEVLYDHDGHSSEPTYLYEHLDIEDAVQLVANTPVGGRSA